MPIAAAAAKARGIELRSKLYRPRRDTLQLCAADHVSHEEGRFSLGRGRAIEPGLLRNFFRPVGCAATTLLLAEPPTHSEFPFMAHEGCPYVQVRLAGRKTHQVRGGMITDSL